MRLNDEKVLPSLIRLGANILNKHPKEFDKFLEDEITIESLDALASEVSDYSTKADVYGFLQVLTLKPLIQEKPIEQIEKRKEKRNIRRRKSTAYRNKTRKKLAKCFYQVNDGKCASHIYVKNLHQISLYPNDLFASACEYFTMQKIAAESPEALELYVKDFKRNKRDRMEKVWKNKKD